MVDVSVIVAAWNADKTVVNAVRSACAQVGVTLEVVVADDASTDGTAAAVREIGDPRVHYLRLPTNGGPAAARNAAIDAARGTWIAVLDADDRLLPGRLAGLAASAARHGLDIVTDNMWIEDPAGRRRLFIDERLDAGVERLALAEYVMRNRLFGTRLGDGYLKPMFAAGLMRRHALCYDTTARIGEDFLLVAEAMTLGATYGRVRSAGYVYTTGGISVSRRLRHQDAEAMISADRRLIARHAGSLAPAERVAWDAHLASLRDGASFIAMVDSIKARDFASLAWHFGQRPAAIRHFAMPIRARLDRAGCSLRAARDAAAA